MFISSVMCVKCIRGKVLAQNATCMARGWPKRSPSYQLILQTGYLKVPIGFHQRITQMAKLSIDKYCWTHSWRTCYYYFSFASDAWITKATKMPKHQIDKRMKGTYDNENCLVWEITPPLLLPALMVRTGSSFATSVAGELLSRWSAANSRKSFRSLLRNEHQVGTAQPIISHRPVAWRITIMCMVPRKHIWYLVPGTQGDIPISF